MIHRYAHLALFSLLGFAAAAQYCSPNFANGCFNWYSMSVQAGSINWAPGADACSTSDYTSVSTTVDAGAMLPMSVTNGVWCGCAVWVDLDQSNSFEDSENLYFNYVGGAPSYEYQFSIAIPESTPSGQYRMRIISPWGSDGFQTSNGNGFGPCGAFQYGDFKDFTLNVIGAARVEENEGAMEVRLSPNPANGQVSITGLPATGTLQAFDMRGALVRQVLVTRGTAVIDTRDWQPGTYAVRMADGSRNVRRFVVE